jgi:uncharacterized protein YyaL (SSP411 family)
MPYSRLTHLLLWLVAFSLFDAAHAQPPKKDKQEKQHKHTNALAKETSPYLLQHAHNPVNWYPWGDAAFRLAKEKNLPILLSVGYSTCHWCHVMERESFEKEEVAKAINADYVAIKVDREERPEVDEQFMLATQLITRAGGGWPNTVWLTPEGKPFFAATYLPKDALLEVSANISDAWGRDEKAIRDQADRIAEVIKKFSDGTLQTETTDEDGGTAGEEEKPKLSSGVVDLSLLAILSAADEVNGGFGTRPKFPPHDRLRLLLRVLQQDSENQEAERNAKIRDVVGQTLAAIWQGGIHDHLGGGFHRYSTDERWLLPHFEKMLYDNAQLLEIYADAYEIWSKSDKPEEQEKAKLFKLAAQDILRWVQTEMTAEQGGFYSAIDSETAGEEGVYYVWSPEDLQMVLGEKDAKLFASVYGFEPGGNFLDEASRKRTGKNIVHLPKSVSTVAKEKGLKAEKLAEQLTSMRNKLLTNRQKREPPHKDDKVITSWNGLMIGALARAGQVFEDPAFTDAAVKAAEFLRTEMVAVDKAENSNTEGEGQGTQADLPTLFRTYRNGQRRFAGTLNDYAFLADGLLNLYAATGDKQWLKWSTQLADTMLIRFQDKKQGGFFLAASQSDYLIVRSKMLTGGGNMPTGNGVAALVLLRLHKETDEAKYKDAARRTLENFAPTMRNYPGTGDTQVEATAFYFDGEE